MDIKKTKMYCLRWAGKNIVSAMVSITSFNEDCGRVIGTTLTTSQAQKLKVINES
jgi:hypothetical protein